MNENKKRISKRTVGLIAIMLVLAALIVAFFVLKSYNKKAADADTDEKFSIVSIAPSSVKSMSIEGTNGTFTFERSGDTFTAGGDAADITELDTDKIEELIDHACTLESDYDVKDHGELSEYGLEEPALKVTLTLDGGDSTVISFGDDNSSVSRFYAMVSGSDSVYLVSLYDRNHLDIEKDDIEKEAESTAQ